VLPALRKDPQFFDCGMIVNELLNEVVSLRGQVRLLEEDVRDLMEVRDRLVRQTGWREDYEQTRTFLFSTHAETSRQEDIVKKTYDVRIVRTVRVEVDLAKSGIPDGTGCPQPAEVGDREEHVDDDRVWLYAVVTDAAMAEEERHDLGWNRRIESITER
jgi:hypothetical protein